MEKQQKILSWEYYCEEIRPYWLRMTKGYGFSIADIDSSCPSDLEPYEKAYKQEREEDDLLQHSWWGSYGLSAVSVAVEHCLAGRKAKLKYIEKPVFFEETKEEYDYKESQEEVAVFEMKQRIELLRKKGLPESPM